MLTSSTKSRFGPAKRKPEQAAPRLPNQLDNRMRAAAAALPGLRRRWNELSTHTPTSILDAAEALRAELDHMLSDVYSASEDLIEEARDLGRTSPVPQELNHAILKANLKGGEANERWLDVFLPAKRRGSASPRVVRSLAMAFDGLVGCLADVLAAYVNTSGGEPASS